MSINKQYRINYNSFNVLAYICDICNYDCWYCYNKKPRTNEFLNLSNLYTFIKYLRQKIPDNIEVDLIGGEPTLHSKLYDFCKKVYQETSNITITIYTNFSSKENFFRKLSDIGVRFEATYHLKNESFFNKVLKFSPKSFRTVTIMYEKTNSKKCISIYNQLKTYGYTVDMQPIFLKDRLDSYSEKQLNDLEAIEKKEQKLFAVETETGIKYVSHNELYSLTKYNYKYWMCDACKKLLYIHCDGDIYNCDGYYFENKKPICNLYDYRKVIFKRTLCQINNCPHEDNLTKIRVISYGKT